MNEHPLWWHEIALSPDPGSAAAARQFVHEQLGAHDLSHLAEDIALVASELATNVIMHALTPFTVRLSAFPDAVILAVVDGSVQEPVLLNARALDVSGRGIAIVDVVSGAWGVVVTADVGKSVWASFTVR